MTEHTIYQLKKAGWYEHRKYSDDISDMIREYKMYNINIPENVKRFLKEFGGLKIANSDRCNDVSFTVDNMIKKANYGFYYRILREYGKDKTAYPIGTAYKKNMYILMDEDDIFYKYYAGRLLIIGKNVDEMLDNLVGEESVGEYIEK